ncbi:hypothetical protein DSCA_49500 [Desulfosarcina alkanivorans]|uniref:Uncharacterized protein n=1 Tax=Desulfosarcina alkanivorans TaxID=571177 RepID=A0A5K7YRN4_9BACT|nr:hypothetical protein DSCA_49500 [Desulfosarcina alkanivorans]
MFTICLNFGTSYISECNPNLFGFFTDPNILISSKTKSVAKSWQESTRNGEGRFCEIDTA